MGLGLGLGVRIVVNPSPTPTQRAKFESATFIERRVEAHESGEG